MLSNILFILFLFFLIEGNPKLLVVDQENLIRIQHQFHLDETVNETYKNLLSLRGFAFDWARYDGNFDHVHATRAFTRKLDDFGIEHEAEKYRSTLGTKRGEKTGGSIPEYCHSCYDTSCLTVISNAGFTHEFL
jgi:hypothetical protein